MFSSLVRELDTAIFILRMRTKSHQGAKQPHLVEAKPHTPNPAHLSTGDAFALK